MALAADRNTKEAAGQVFSGPMAAAVLCYAGALLVRDASGNIKPGVTGTGLVVAGRCEAQAGRCETKTWLPQGQTRGGHRR